MHAEEEWALQMRLHSLDLVLASESEEELTKWMFLLLNLHPGHQDEDSIADDENDDISKSKHAPSCCHHNERSPCSRI